MLISPTLGPAVKPTLYERAGISVELTASNDADGPNISITTLSEPVRESSHSLPPARCPLLLTTSGSTGVPKVVRLTADGVCAFINWSTTYFQLSRGSRILSLAPLNFDLSLLEVWTPLAIGGTAILIDSERATQSGHLANSIKKCKPDLIQGVPLFYNVLCKTPDLLGDSGLDVRHILFTGDTTPQHLREQVGGMFPDARFHNVYGCTETNDSFIHSTNADSVTQGEALPLGQTIDGVDYRIQTDEGFDLDGEGEGELHVSTPFQAKGYSDPQQTNRVFYKDPDSNRAFYKTGDRVKRDSSGRLILIGRNDFIVKVRGVRTNLQEIEQTLLGIPNVTNAVVIPIKDDMAGTILHAVLECEPGSKPEGITIRMHCAQNLPNTSIPRHFHIHESPIPKTSTGKPDRQAIMRSLISQRSEKA